MPDASLRARCFRSLPAVIAAVFFLFPGSCRAQPPPTPDADRFNQPGDPLSLSGDERELKIMVMRWSARTGRSAPLLDAGLTYVCRNIAWQLSRLGPDQMSVFNNARVQEEMIRFGVSDSAIRTQMATSGRLEDLDQMLSADILKELADGRYTHFGVGVIKTALPRGYYIMLLFSRRPVALDPFPKRAGEGERVDLSGRLLQGLRDPKVYIGLPSGEVREIEIHADQNGSFHTGIIFDKGSGIYRVEVFGESSLGPEIVALMPVEVGDFQKPAAAAAMPEAETPEEARAWLLEQINRERQQAGAPPLKLHGALSRVAQGHVEEMRRRKMAVHRSEVTGMVGDRATAAGIAWRKIGENVALNQSVLAAHASLMESPAHRANVLDPEFRYLGVGIAFDDDGHGHRLSYLVENYLTLQE